MNKKKVFKIIGLVIVVILILFLIYCIRNFIIIKNLQKNIEQYTSKSEYSIKSISTEENGVVIETQYYRKDNKQKLVLIRKLDNTEYRIESYNNGERTDIFWDNPEKKTAKINSGEIMGMNIENNFSFKNIFQTLLYAINNKIDVTEYNGKNCYVISRRLYKQDEREVLYIEKDTGLVLKSVYANNIVTEKEYSFENIEDDIFTEPDIGQYTINE